MTTIDDKEGADVTHQEQLLHLDGANHKVAPESPHVAQQDLGLLAALKHHRKAAFWSAVMSLTLVMEGYDRALIGNFWALPAFAQRYGVYVPTSNSYTVEAKWQTAVSDMSIVGCFIGALTAGWEVDRLGYRRTVIANLFAMIPCIALVTFAPNIVALFMGEFLCGLPWGVFAALGPAYASEVCPDALRGYLTTYVNLCWVMGQFIASGVVLGIQGMSGQWAYRIPFALQWFWPCVLIPILYFAPESPWWLVRRGKIDEAKRAVRSLVSKHDVDSIDSTVDLMIRTNQLELDAKALEKAEGTSYLDCFRGANLRRTEISAVAWAAQILSGDGFAGYVTYFFVQAGLSTSQSYKLGLANTAGAFIGTVGSWFLLARFGRRSIFVGGCLWLALLWLIIGGLSVVADKGQPEAKWGQAALFLVWVLSYDFTLGPIAYCIVGESSQTRLRQKTVALSRNAFYVCSIVSGVVSPYMLNPTNWNWRGKSGFFWAAPALRSPHGASSDFPR